jgi:hypothetical protein
MVWHGWDRHVMRTDDRDLSGLRWEDLEFQVSLRYIGNLSFRVRDHPGLPDPVSKQTDIQQSSQEECCGMSF